MFNFSLRSRKPKSAETAKERLQILLAHERAAGDGPDYLPMLQKEILEVVRRHVQIEGDDIDIKLERGEDISCLEINIDLPGAAKLRSVARR